jgi:hypothetical protein
MTGQGNPIPFRQYALRTCLSRQINKIMFAELTFIGYTEPIKTDISKG